MLTFIEEARLTIMSNNYPNKNQAANANPHKRQKIDQIQKKIAPYNKTFHMEANIPL